ncbi:MAG: helix-turn-helix domain-containing protein [Pedobacter sp.]|nr:helix-turn-helix domain-containing protein [Pedobacter sp.]MDQ8051704.1 helix-turn-helix domain-containing protein [Pedobacter sp.]
MFNLYDKIKDNPDFYRQLRCGDSLTTQFQCLLESKYEDTWSQYNYFVYVVEGHKIWHTADGSYDLKKGDCVFIRKGACIIEQFFETTSCFIIFFMTDDFIYEALQAKARPMGKTDKRFDSVITLADDTAIQSFFISMVPYFSSHREPDEALLVLKFKELVLTFADNVANDGLHAYFSYLLQQPRKITLQQVMEENFCFNLKLPEFARLSNRSLSAFKRDFEYLYQISPGKWLLEKRLNYAHQLLSLKGKTVAEAAFESGFESTSHFSRAFRLRFGQIPRSLRQPLAS